MNIVQIRTWSERQQVFAVLLLAGGILFSLWYFLLLAQHRELRDIEGKIEAMRNNLAVKGLLLDEETLQGKVRAEETAYQSLIEEWTASAQRLATFPNQKSLATNQVSHIDFKVALANIRQYLAKRSRAANIRIPYDLGIEDAVDTSEEPRKLMLQLRSVETLSSLLIDLKIQSLREIRPQPPILHAVGQGGAEENYIEEYPVFVDFLGTLENLYDLYSAVLEPDHVFFLKNLRVESAEIEGQDLLRIKAVLSAPVFFKSPAEMRPVPRKVTWRSGPKGA